LLKLCDSLVDFLAHARKRGLIAKDIDARMAARSLFSQISHQTRTDETYRRFHGVSLRQEAYRNSWVRQTVRIFLHGAGGDRHESK
jgi:hypothetical protein